MADVVQILGESDWDDQDLLTIDEAHGRLREEIEAIEARLASATASTEGALMARAAALRECLARIDAGPTDRART